MTDEHDDAMYREVNALIARVGALERLVTHDIARRWTAGEIEHWATALIEHNDDVAASSELGRAYWTNALHDLAKRLRAAKRARED